MSQELYQQAKGRTWCVLQKHMVQAVDDLLFTMVFSCKNEAFLVFCCRSDLIPTAGILLPCFLGISHMLFSISHPQIKWSSLQRVLCGLSKGVF